MKKLYYTEEYINGKLIQENLEISKNKEVTEDFLKEIIQLLEESTNDNMQHRCISVYRHGFILDNDIYNICISCGDFYKNEEHHYIYGEKFEELKEKLTLKTRK